MARTGRPTKYQDEHCDLAHKLALLGCTNSEIAQTLGIGDTTFDNWLATRPEFRGAIAAGREKADAEVASSLYDRAVGAEVWADKVDKNGTVHRLEAKLAPDTGAAALWLHNRQPDRWRRQPDIQISVKADLTEYLAELQRRLGTERAQVIAQQFGFGHLIEGQAELVGERAELEVLDEGAAGE